MTLTQLSKLMLLMAGSLEFRREAILALFGAVLASGDCLELRK